MKNQSPTQYFFDLIEKELKEYEKQIAQKNPTAQTFSSCTPPPLSPVNRRVSSLASLPLLPLPRFLFIH